MSPEEIEHFARLIRAQDARQQVKEASPAPDVPGAEEVEAIRQSHEAAAHAWLHGYFDSDYGLTAHADRATLLRLLDAAREELREVREAAAKRLEPDMFWDFDNAEQPYWSIEELIGEERTEGEGIVQVQQAVICPDAAYAYRYTDDPESDDRALTVERLSEDEYKHYRAAMSVATGAREMWRQMVDNLAAKLFEENPAPLHAWMHGKPWSSIHYEYKKHHRDLAHVRLAAALKEPKP